MIREVIIVITQPLKSVWSIFDNEAHNIISQRGIEVLEMKLHSKKNTYSTSGGTRLTRSQIESRIRAAKSTVIDRQLLSHGYNFCEECGVNASGGEPLDCAHDVSVKECLESGRAELAYDTMNIEVLCRPCHRKKDKTFLG